MRVWMISVFAALSIAGCDGDDPGGRLIPPGDVDHSALETPESPGECTQTTDCEVSCRHACAPIPTGPVTCPTDPPPVPARVQGASCVCDQGLCVYF